LAANSPYNRVDYLHQLSFGSNVIICTQTQTDRRTDRQTHHTAGRLHYAATKVVDGGMWAYSL